MRKRLEVTIAAAALMAAAGPPAAAQEGVPGAPQPEASARHEATIGPPQAVVQMAAWVRTSGDNGGLPYMIIDKVAAGVWVFDMNGLPMGATPALLGATAGDDAEPGIGDRELSDIPPELRTTPAGRFVASFGSAQGGRSVLWVDYPTAVSLHAVVTHNKKERRLERLESPAPDDNRITYGCINVPAAFYKNVVRTLFSTANGIVYVLPDTKRMTDVFPGYRPQLPQYRAVYSR